MSNSTATITISSYPIGIDNTQRNEHVRGTITLSAGLYPVGGFPLAWGVEQIKALPASSTSGPFPIDVDIKSVKNPPSGWFYFWDNTTGNLHIFCPSNGASGASGPMVEYGGNLITSQINDVIVFRAVFSRN